MIEFIIDVYITGLSKAPSYSSHVESINAPLAIYDYMREIAKVRARYVDVYSPSATHKNRYTDVRLVQGVVEYSSIEVIPMES